MASSTTNLNLTKPTTSENFNLSVINGNWDKIDAGYSKSLFTVTNAASYFTRSDGSTENSIRVYAVGNNITMIMQIASASVASGENTIGTLSKYRPYDTTVYAVGFIGASSAIGTLLRCQINTSGVLTVYSGSSASGTIRVAFSYPVANSALP